MPKATCEDCRIPDADEPVILCSFHSYGREFLEASKKVVSDFDSMMTKGASSLEMSVQQLRDLIAKSETIVDAKVLAKEFSTILNRWLGQKKMKIVIERNRTNEYEGACASHDFCDANMAMAEAFENVFEREFEVQSSKDSAIFNEAWDLAKLAEFVVQS